MAIRVEDRRRDRAERAASAFNPTSHQRINFNAQRSTKNCPGLFAGGGRARARMATRPPARTHAAGPLYRVSGHSLEHIEAAHERQRLAVVPRSLGWRGWIFPPFSRSPFHWWQLRPRQPGHLAGIAGSSHSAPTASGILRSVLAQSFDLQACLTQTILVVCLTIVRCLLARRIWNASTVTP